MQSTILRKNPESEKSLREKIEKKSKIPNKKKTVKKRLLLHAADERREFGAALPAHLTPALAETRVALAPRGSWS